MGKIWKVGKNLEIWGKFGNLEKNWEKLEIWKQFETRKKIGNLEKNWKFEKKMEIRKTIWKVGKELDLTYVNFYHDILLKYANYQLQILI